MKNYLLFILALLFTGYSFTQVSTLKGRVLDSNGFALPGATIQASPSGKAVVTDFDGFYTIVGIEGDQIIKVSYIGFETVEESVSVDSGATSKLDFTLETAVSELAEVVVSGSYANSLISATELQTKCASRYEGDLKNIEKI